MTAETFEAVYVVKVDPVLAQSVSFVYCAAIKVAIVESVPTDCLEIAMVIKSVYPCIENPVPCVHLSFGRASTNSQERVLFMDDAAETLLERSDGLWPAVE